MSAALLSERLATLPGHLRAVRAAVPRDLLRGAGRVVVTGGGLSEGPARLLVALLRQRLGLSADFVPQSEFALRALPELPGPADALVLFSQGLAPNARLPLPHAAHFCETVVFTSVQTTLDHARAVVLPPPEENGLLLRIVGTAVQCYAAAWMVNDLALARGLDDHQAVLERVPEVYRSPTPGCTLVDGDSLPPVAIVAAGRYAELAFGLRWKLLEGLHVPDPPVWDVLQVAHGPFQQLFDHRMTLLAMMRPDAPHEEPLYDRLQAVLRPERHRLLRLRANLPSPYAWFEHDALLDALVIDAVGRRGIDLSRWPGKGLDGPLYDVAPETL
jgi:creatinine amidohydrolase